MKDGTILRSRNQSKLCVRLNVSEHFGHIEIVVHQRSDFWSTHSVSYLAEGGKKQLKARESLLTVNDKHARRGTNLKAVAPRRQDQGAHVVAELRLPLKYLFRL